MSNLNYGYRKIGLVEVGSRSVRYLVAQFDRNSKFLPISIETYRHNVDPSRFEKGDVEKINQLVDQAATDMEVHACDVSLIYGTEICRRISEQSNFKLSEKVRVLAAKEEALAAWAAGLLCEEVCNEEKRIVVIDEGNGSTEIIAANWHGSFIDEINFAGISIGSADLLSTYEKNPRRYLHELIEKVASVSHDLHSRGFAKKNKSRVYLAGGVATKIAWLNVRRAKGEHYKPHLVNGAHLSVPYLLRLYSKLSEMYEKSPRAAIEFVDNRRGSESDTPRIISSAPFLAKLRSEVAIGEDIFVTGYGVRHGMAFLINNGLMSLDTK